mgnify:CR=1 FL=1
MQKTNIPQAESKSADLVAQNLEQLKQIFPEVIKEGRVDFEVLNDLLGNYGDTAEERFCLNWAGKANARREAQKRSTGTLRPCPEDSVDWDSTENLYIEGDNLEVLKLLQKSYHSRVKMIYIDPPYNTGKDFVYKDNYADNMKNYLELTGQDKKLSTNTESDGRYHSNWLNMMYPRLKLARNLLTDDGVIFISIDDNEVANLRKVCDEIFGEENFRNMIQVRRYDKNLNRQFMDDGLITLNVGLEQILIYGKNSQTKLSPVFRVSNDNRANTGYWKGFWNNANRPTMRYDILGFTPEDGQWKWQKEVAKEAVKNYQDYIDHYSSQMSIEEYWISTGKSKKFIKRNSNGQGKNKGVEHWIAPTDGILRNSNWSDLLASKPTGVDIPFDSPKNVEVLIELIKLSGADTDDLILDFFSGSATTAHAVMQLNAEDDGNRKYICVQLPEATPEDSEARKAGYITIPEIAKERIRRAGKKILEEQKAKVEKEGLFTEEPKKLDTGFKVFKLDSSNINAWDSNPDNLETALNNSLFNIKTERSEDDLLYEILIKYGIELTEKINRHTIDGKTVYEMGAGSLMVCLADSLSTAVADGIGKLYKAVSPEGVDGNCRVVFKEAGFDGSDEVKTNTLLILKQHGITNVATV